MDNCAAMNDVVANLARLRTNAALAMRTSGERAVSAADLARLDAIVAQVFGGELDNIESAPLGLAPKPDGPTLRALREQLPEDQAQGAERFLVDLHDRIDGWFHN